VGPVAPVGPIDPGILKPKAIWSTISPCVYKLNTAFNAVVEFTTVGLLVIKIPFL
jgi:hypothetical protein